MAEGPTYCEEQDQESMFKPHTDKISGIFKQRVIDSAPFLIDNAV